VHLPHLPEKARPDDLNSLAHAGVGNALRAHLSGDTAGSGNRRQAATLADARCKRLLAIAVFTEAYGQECSMRMSVVRSADDNSTNVMFSRKEFPVIAISRRRGEHRCRSQKGILVDVTNRRDLRQLADIA
jgi:hypothetical protein